MQKSVLQGRFSSINTGFTRCTALQIGLLNLIYTIKILQGHRLALPLQVVCQSCGHLL